MFQITGQLLEVKQGEFQGSTYASLKLRSEDVADNTILKYKVDLKRVSIESLKESLDTEITVDCDLIKGQNDAATIKVIGFS